MGLRLTRPVNSRVFIGDKIDGDNMEKAADQTVWVRKVHAPIDENDKSYTVINVRSKRSISEEYLETDDVLQISRFLKVKFKGVSASSFTTKAYCPVCGQGSHQPVRIIPQAQLQIDAPANFRILRDDYNNG